jgi:hypothetical protein
MAMMGYFLLTNLVGGFEAVHDRHLHIHGDEIEFLVGDQA